MSYIRRGVHPALLLVILALLYIVFGKLALMLAIPPGYATSIWPSAGIAIIFAYVFGPFVALGALIGSFTLNASIASQNFTQFDFHLFLSPFVISIGIYLHSIVGAYLLKKFTKYPDMVEDPKEILFFIFIAGFLSCIISASFGALSLCTFDIVPWDYFFITWFTWWVGDSIGVFLMAPLTLMIIRNHKKALQATVPIILFLTIAISIFITVSRYEQGIINTTLKQKAEKFDDHLALAIEDYIEFLVFTRQYMENSQKTTIDEFKSYTSHIFESHKGIHAIEWIPIVESQNRDYFEEKATEVLGRKYIIRERNELGDLVPASKRDKYYPVYYLYPERGNEKAYGFDLGSQPDRVDAIKKALRSNSATATKAIHLVQESQKAPAFLVFVPVQKSNIVNSFILGVFKVKELVDVALRSVSVEGLNYEIYEQRNGHKNILFKKGDSEKKKVLFSHEVKVANEVWYINAWPDQDYLLANKSWTTWIFSTVGLLLTGFFGFVLLTTLGKEMQIQREVDKKTEELKKVNNMKSTFYANMSHEIRTPMNGILGMTDLILMNKNIDSETKELAQVIKNCGHSLLTIVNDVLDYSKITSGKLVIEKHDVEIRRTLDEVISLFRSQANEKGIELESSVDEDVPEMISTDIVRFKQIINNLLSNAIKFTNLGSVKVHISLEEKIEDEANINISVQDTGIGLSSESLEKIFLSFTQAESSTTREYGGTGLGLSISKYLVELLGGQIRVRSKKDEGSTFSFNILAKVVEKGSERVEKQNELEKVLAEDFPLEILLVEDNLVNQKFAVLLLKKHGYHIDVANNGHEGVEAIKKKQYDLVLMDMQMPVMDGVEATRLIRRDHNRENLFIYAMTANAYPEDRQKCFDAGMNGHLAKPVQVRELEDVLVSVYTKIKNQS